MPTEAKSNNSIIAGINQISFELDREADGPEDRGRYFESLQSYIEGVEVVGDEIVVHTQQGISAPKLSTYKETVTMNQQQTLLVVNGQVALPQSAMKSAQGEVCVNDASSAFSCALHKLNATTTSSVNLDENVASPAAEQVEFFLQ